MRRSVETGPLYAAAVSATTAVTCVVRRDEALLTLKYQLGNGNWVHATRDASIEYFELEAHFARPPVEAPEVLLTRAEKAAFGIGGCRINWQQPELDTDAHVGSTDTVFRGAVCSCQARITRDASGRVVGLALRSAC